MKKLKIPFLCIAAFLWIIGAFTAPLVLERALAVPIDQYHSGWHLIEAVASEDAADFATALPLATNKGDFANKTTEAFQIPSWGSYGGHEGYSPGTQWMFAFCGTDAADETFSFTMVGWAKTNGMAQIICEGNGVLGTQDIVIYPGGASVTGFWADTISLDETTKWPKQRSGNLAGTAIYNSGDNEVALLVVDLAGIEWIDFVTYDVAGSAEASTLGVYGRRW